MKKLISLGLVGVVALAAFVLSPDLGRAQTNAELKAQTITLANQVKSLATNGSYINSQWQSHIQSLLQLIQNMQTSDGGACQLTMDMQVGSAHTVQVPILRAYLFRTGYSDAPVNNGYYNPALQQSLAAYQAANGISPANGALGPISRAHINNRLTSTDCPRDPANTEATLSVSPTNGQLNAHETMIIDNSPDDVAIFGFTLEAKNGDVNIDNLAVTLKANGAEVDMIANWVSLLIGSDEVEAVSIPATATNSYLAKFMGLDQELEEGEKVNLIVSVDLNEFSNTDPGFSAGDSLYVTIGTAEKGQFAVEDDAGDNLPIQNLLGTATGGKKTFMADGLAVSLVSTSAEKSPSGNEATFQLVYDVEAIGNDLFIDKDCLEWTATAKATSYAVTNGEINRTTCVLTSTAGVSAASYEVQEGETERFTLTVNTVASASQFTKMKLTGIGYNTTDANGNKIYTQNLADFETDVVALSGSPVAKSLDNSKQMANSLSALEGLMKEWINNLK